MGGSIPEVEKSTNNVTPKLEEDDVVVSDKAVQIDYRTTVNTKVSDGEREILLFSRQTFTRSKTEATQAQ